MAFKSRDRTKGRNGHSYVRDADELVKSLEDSDFVRGEVGFGRFRRTRNGEENVKIKYYDSTKCSFKLNYFSGEFVQELLVRVDPARRYFLERFVDLYNSSL